MLNLEPEVHWIGETDNFWYRHETHNGYEFRRVSAATSKADVAFNHVALARTLSEQYKLESDPSALPFRHITFSADASEVVFKIDQHRYSCQIDGAVCTSEVTDAADPKLLVAPGGAKALFIQDHNLWLRDLASGSNQALTHDGEDGFEYGKASYSNSRLEQQLGIVPNLVENTTWSPDGRYVLTIRTDMRTTRFGALVTQQIPEGDNRSQAFLSRTRIASDQSIELSYASLIDTQTGQVAQVQISPELLYDYAIYWATIAHPTWDLETGTLYLLTSTRDATRVGLVEVDIGSGRTRTIIEESSEHYINLNPFDYNLPNVRVLPRRNELVWWSERSGWGHLYVYDLSTGAFKHAITKGDWSVFDIIDVDEANATIYFTAGGRELDRNPYYRHLYRADLDGRHIKLITPENADHIYAPNPSPTGLNILRPSDKRLSPSKLFVVDTYSTVTDAPKTVIRRTDTGELVGDVVTADISKLEALGWRPPQRFEIPTADGRELIHGIIIKPTNFDPTKSYPIIDRIYGGPQITSAPQSFADTFRYWGANTQALAELGFIIVMMDARGTPRRSRAFRMHPVGSEDPFGMFDHASTIEALAQTYSYMDGTRVGIWGHSFGGYAATKAILLYPDVYTTAVATAGPNDLRLMPSSVSVERFFGVPSHPPTDDDRYTLAENTRLADRLEGNLLLIYGETDQNLLLNQGAVMVDALIKANKDFDYLVIPNAPHSVGQHPYTLRRMGDYFVRHLIGTEPPRPFVSDLMAY